MPSVIRWLYLNIKYRVCALPNEPGTLQKLAMNLNVPLAFTYRATGLDMTLAQQRIHESLNSFSVDVVIALVMLTRWLRGRPVFFSSVSVVQFNLRLNLVFPLDEYLSPSAV
jgi:hypothetical protein